MRATIPCASAHFPLESPGRNEVRRRVRARAAPKAQPARKRSGKRTAGTGELWRGAGPGYGNRRHGTTDSALRPARRRRRAHGRLRRLGHARQLRLADRGTPRGAPRRRHVRRLAHVHRSTCAAPASARLPARLLANDVGQAHGSPARRSTAACCDRARRRHRRPDRLLPGRQVVPAGRQCGHARQGYRLAASEHAKPIRRRRRAAARPRDDRGAGSERARKSRQRHGAGRRARAAAASSAPFSASTCDACSSRAPATRARTAGRSCCPPRGRGVSGTRCAPPASARAGSARATRCGSRRA